MHQQSSEQHRKKASLLASAITLMSLSFTSHLLSATEVRIIPEVPANVFEIPPISNLRDDDGNNNPFAYPHLTPFHTTLDGRLGIRVTRDDDIEFYLIKPEMLNRHLLHSERGIRAVDQRVPFPAAQVFTRDNSRMFARNLCEKNTNNPRAETIDGKSVDVYHVTIYGIANRDNSARLQSVDFRITVDNPKTPDARILTIEPLPNTEVYQTLDPTIYGATRLVELNVTADGKLMLAKFSSRGSTWHWRSKTSNAENIFPENSRPIVYAYSDKACDITQWADLNPLTHAFHDSRVNSTYGFAEYQIRDAEGNLLTDGESIRGGQYPWLSSDGNMLLLELNGEMLHYIDSKTGEIAARYPRSCAIGDCNIDNPASTPERYIGRYESRRNVNRGVVALGRWTHGKMVELDNLLNYMDYGVNGADRQHFYLNLFKPGSASGNSITHREGKVLIAHNKQEGRRPVIPLSMNEGAQIWSVEHRFNFLPTMRPITPRDVVWQVSKGNGITEEVVFDDFVDPNVLIYAPMNTSFNNNKYNRDIDPMAEMQGYNNGFKRTSMFAAEGFVEPVHFQNAATADVDIAISDATLQNRQRYFDIPDYGVGIGSMRIEPTALGGIRGKGAWLEGNSGIAFDIPQQPKSVEQGSWYFGIFIDPRTETTQRLLTLPNHAYATINSRENSIELWDANHQAFYRYTINSSTGRDLLQREQWMHLGLQIEPTRVELFINGHLVNRTNLDAENPFYLNNNSLSGRLIIGATHTDNHDGFRGWVDDFKMIHIPNTGLSQEMYCEHARGTLVSLPDNYNGALREISMRQNDRPRIGWALITRELRANGHDNLISSAYACHTDYQTRLGASLADMPANTMPLRDALLVKQPLLFGAPRPDATQNRFCLLCHVDSHSSSLNVVDALGLRAINTESDPRRQPLQPLPLIHGVIPAQLFGNTPSNTIETPAEGLRVDQFLLN